MKAVHGIGGVALAVGVVVVVVVALWRLTGTVAAPPAALAEAAAQAAVQAAPASAPARRETPRSAQAQSELSHRLAAALGGLGGGDDLSHALRQLGQRCSGLAPSPCVDEVLAGLPAAERARMADLLARLPLLGPRLSGLAMSTRQPMLDRIDAVSQVRAQVLGEANARLLFGREEAQLRYQARLEQFVENDAARLPLAQRLAAADALRHAPGETPSDKPTDDPDEHASRYALTLRLTLLDAKDDADRQRLARQVRTQFFSPEQVEQLAVADRYEAQQHDRMALYAERKQAIQARYAGTDEPSAFAQRQAELDALRHELFPDSFAPR